IQRWGVVSPASVGVRRYGPANPRPYVVAFNFQRPSSPISPIHKEHTMSEDFTIFAGRANVALATSVAVEMGARLGACSVERFPDGELSVRLDEPVRGRKVFIIQ